MRVPGWHTSAYVVQGYNLKPGAACVEAWRCRRSASGPGAPLPRLSLSGPDSLCVGPRRFLSRSLLGPAALFWRCLCRGPALCVRARQSLFQNPAGARRSLCWGPVLSVESRRRGPAVLSQGSIFQVPAVCVSGLALFVCLSRPNNLCLVVSGPGALSVGARGSLCPGGGALSIGLGARRSLCRSPRSPAVPLCRDPELCVSASVGALRFPVVSSESVSLFLPALFVPGAPCVGARCSLSRVGVGARRSLPRLPFGGPASLCGGALCVGAGALCRSSALFGALCDPAPRASSSHPRATHPALRARSARTAGPALRGPSSDPPIAYLPAPTSEAPIRRGGAPAHRGPSNTPGSGPRASHRCSAHIRAPRAPSDLRSACHPSGTADPQYRGPPASACHPSSRAGPQLPSAFPFFQERIT